MPQERDDVFGIFLYFVKFLTNDSYFFPSCRLCFSTVSISIIVKICINQLLRINNKLLYFITRKAPKL